MSYSKFQIWLQTTLEKQWEHFGTRVNISYKHGMNSIITTLTLVICISLGDSINCWTVAV